MALAERSSATIARRYLAAVMETCDALSMFPQRGVPRDDIREGMRLTHHRGRTVIAYTVNREIKMVFIVGVFHGGRNYEPSLK